MKNKEKNYVITDEIKDKVKQAYENKLIKDNKGLGYDSKDATIAIREALGSNEVLDKVQESLLEDKDEKARLKTQKRGG